MQTRHGKLYTPSVLIYANKSIQMHSAPGFKENMPANWSINLHRFENCAEKFIICFAVDLPN